MEKTAEIENVAAAHVEQEPAVTMLAKRACRAVEQFLLAPTTPKFRGGMLSIVQHAFDAGRRDAWTPFSTVWPAAGLEVVLWLLNDEGERQAVRAMRDPDEKVIAWGLPPKRGAA
jgi:hypothetical protein